MVFLGRHIQREKRSSAEIIYWKQDQSVENEECLFAIIMSIYILPLWIQKQHEGTANMIG